MNVKVRQVIARNGFLWVVDEDGRLWIGEIGPAAKDPIEVSWRQVQLPQVHPVTRGGSR